MKLKKLRVRSFKTLLSPEEEANARGGKEIVDPQIAPPPTIVPLTCGEGDPLDTND